MMGLIPDVLLVEQQWTIYWAQTTTPQLSASFALTVLNSFFTCAILWLFLFFLTKDLTTYTAARVGQKRMKIIIVTPMEGQSICTFKETVSVFSKSV